MLAEAVGISGKVAAATIKYMFVFTTYKHILCIFVFCIMHSKLFIIPIK